MTNGKPKLPPRQSLNEEAGEQTDTQAIRRPIGQMKNLDADYYVAKYPECKFIWENDIGGAVQRWIDYGAEPVEVENRSGRTFEASPTNLNQNGFAPLVVMMAWGTIFGFIS